MAASTSTASLSALKAVLVVFGLLVLFTALNRAFGGIATLGWQGPSDFFAIANDPAFRIQDSHTRFLGGIWTAIGLAFVAAPFRLATMRPVLNFLFAAVFLGGLARFTAPDFSVIFGPDVLVSLILELGLMPVLWFWLRTVPEKA